MLCDHTLIQMLEGVARNLEAQGALLAAMRAGLTPTTPPRTLHGCRRDVRTTLRLLGQVDRRPAVTPDDDPPEVVRADAELHAHAGALREQAEALVTDLTRQLRARRPRRDTA
jgi:hypothetical protein